MSSQPHAETLENSLAPPLQADLPQETKADSVDGVEDQATTYNAGQLICVKISWNSPTHKPCHAEK